MNRDDIILSCVNIVNNLVRKYNNRQSDEDLQSVGMIAVIECVDRSLNDNMTDINQIQARCNVWARNRILQEIYKQKLKFVPEGEEIIGMQEYDYDCSELINEIKDELTEKQLAVFELLLKGYSKEEIMKELNIERAMYFRHVQKIKEKF